MVVTSGGNGEPEVVAAAFGRAILSRMPFGRSRHPAAIGRIWRASPKARAELDANLRLLELARIFHGRQLSPELRLIVLIREPVAGTGEQDQESGKM
jgi:hypothetical protein